MGHVHTGECVEDVPQGMVPRILCKEPTPLEWLENYCCGVPRNPDQSCAGRNRFPVEEGKAN